MVCVCVCACVVKLSHIFKITRTILQFNWYYYCIDIARGQRKRVELNVYQHESKYNTVNTQLKTKQSVCFYRILILFEKRSNIESILRICRVWPTIEFNKTISISIDYTDFTMLSTVSLFLSSVGLWLEMCHTYEISTKLYKAQFQLIHLFVFILKPIALSSCAFLLLYVCVHECFVYFFFLILGTRV